jgi:hypothetical protein
MNDIIRKPSTSLNLDNPEESVLDLNYQNILRTLLEIEGWTDVEVSEKIDFIVN